MFGRRIGRQNVPDRLQQAAGIVPRDPFQRRELHILLKKWSLRQSRGVSYGLFIPTRTDRATDQKRNREYESARVSANNGAR